MAMLAARSNAPVEPVEAVGLDGDMLEAQAFAYLAVRVLRGLPTSAPGDDRRAAAGLGRADQPALRAFAQRCTRLQEEARRLRAPSPGSGRPPVTPKACLRHDGRPLLGRPRSRRCPSRGRMPVRAATREVGATVSCSVVSHVQVDPGSGTFPRGRGFGGTGRAGRRLILEGGDNGQSRPQASRRRRAGQGRRHRRDDRDPRGPAGEHGALEPRQEAAFRRARARREARSGASSGRTAMPSHSAATGPAAPAVARAIEPPSGAAPTKG